MCPCTHPTKNGHLAHAKRVRGGGYLRSSTLNYYQQGHQGSVGRVRRNPGPRTSLARNAEQQSLCPRSTLLQGQIRLTSRVCSPCLTSSALLEESNSNHPRTQFRINRLATFLRNLLWLPTMVQWQMPKVLAERRPSNTKKNLLLIQA